MNVIFLSVFGSQMLHCWKREQKNSNEKKLNRANDSMTKKKMEKNGKDEGEREREKEKSASKRLRVEIGIGFVLLYVFYLFTPSRFD